MKHNCVTIGFASGALHTDRTSIAWFDAWSTRLVFRYSPRRFFLLHCSRLVKVDVLWFKLISQSVEMMQAIFLKKTFLNCMTWHTSVAYEFRSTDRWSNDCMFSVDQINKLSVSNNWLSHSFSLKVWSTKDIHDASNGYYRLCRSKCTSGYYYFRKLSTLLLNNWILCACKFVIKIFLFLFLST